jgi:outer membrane lipoprotein-sorting protein
MAGSGCRECEPLLRALQDGELEEAQAERVREHLAECDGCQDALATTVEVSRLVSELPAALEPPPHFSANLQVRLASVRHRRGLFERFEWAGRPRWSRRYSLAGVTVAGTALALVLGSPPRLGAEDLIGKVQESWRRLQSYSCRFVAEAIVAGQPRQFEQRQWFHKPDLFRLETNKHYHETTYLEADRVTTYLPGSNWRGRRVAIIRPRRPREEGLPFPFGAEWPAAADVTMEALVRELRAQQGGEVLGTEEVVGRRCYVLRFRTQRPGDRSPRDYRVWVDGESFLPLKVRSHDDQNGDMVSIAIDLETNQMVPSDTFHFVAPRGTFLVYGEVEPFVFTLPMDRPRTPDFDQDPAGSARSEMRRRAGVLQFQPLAPGHLPAGYVLVRARRSARRGWLDCYWLHEQKGALIKLLEQPARLAPPPSTEDGEPVPLGSASDGQARCRELRDPIPIQYVTWTQDGTRLSLAAAGVDREEALRIAASVAPI